MIERPADRYGRQRLSRRARRWIAAGLTVFILAAGALIALVAFTRLGSGEVEGKLGGYRLVDDETVSVTISVTRADPSRPVVCIVRARAIDGSETGRREVLVPPSTQADRAGDHDRQIQPAARGGRRLRLRDRRAVLPGGLLESGTANIARQQRNKRRTANT